MLFFYQQQVQRYLQYDEQQVEYNPDDLTVFINQARAQIAMSSECIRQPAQLALTAAQQTYLFSAATFVAAPTVLPGLQSVINIRMVRVVLPSGGQQRLEMRSWEWFDTYYLAVSIPTIGQPTICTRLQPGLSGTLWVAPTPDQAYTLNLDAVGYPSPIETDQDPEALPAPWTDAVPMMAAHFALLAMGDQAAADRWWNEYEAFERRAVQGTTPSRLPRNYPGGMGAQIANAKIPLTFPQAPPTARR